MPDSDMDTREREGWQEQLTAAKTEIDELKQELSDKKMELAVALNMIAIARHDQAYIVDMISDAQPVNVH